MICIVYIKIYEIFAATFEKQPKLKHFKNVLTKQNPPLYTYRVVIGIIERLYNV